MVPELIEDNHFVEQPAQPEDGYHFSKDIADKAIGFIRDSKQSQPAKPWYLWYCPGANHAPHHAPQDYIDKYKGKFDDGYEAYRQWALVRMIERGILPKDTKLTPINPMTKGTVAESDLVRPWNTLSDEEKKLFSRMAEVYAAFSEYTDVQVGRLIDYLEESGQIDNTLIFYCADNGASGEGSPNGSVNEIFAQGSRFGGYSMFVKGGKLFFVYNFLGVPPEQRLICPAPALGKHIVGVEFTKEKQGPNGESVGTGRLFVDARPMAEGSFRTMTGRYSLCGEGLCIGYDGGDAVSKEYKPKFPFAGGRVIKVVFDVAQEGYVDVEQELAAAMARD